MKLMVLYDCGKMGNSTWHEVISIEHQPQDGCVFICVSHSGCIGDQWSSIFPIDKAEKFKYGE